MGYAIYIVGFLVLVIITFLAERFISSFPSYPYEKRNSLFSHAERSFLRILEGCVGRQYRIFCKVRLADIIDTKGSLSSKKEKIAFSRISYKHVDFVLCDPISLNVIGIIELDDRSHDLPDRRKRDEFVDRALEAAGVPILHIKVQRSYDTNELRDLINEAFCE